jgi:hypothetical protein
MSAALRYGTRRVLRAVVMALAMCILARAYCLADDAATLDSWQSSFHDVWQADQCATEFESWSKYWGQVHAFYFGGDGSPGWFTASQKALTHVTDATANATVAAQLTSLGRRIGGEWAKGDGCRKVRTRTNMMAKITEPGKPALLDLENQLNKAATADTGNGASIEAAVKSINSQLDALGIAQAE